jgi:ABC-type multidrug transport system fused ATPase/permease subunit
MKIIFKIFSILNKKEKIKILFLFFLMSISVIFEMLGLGILLPVFAIMSSDNFELKYPILKTTINLLGNPSKLEIIKIVIIFIIIFYFIKFLFFIYLYWRQAKFISNFSSNLSIKLFESYIRMPYAFHLQSNSSTLINNTNGEVSVYATGLNAIMTIASEIAIIIGIIIMLIYIEPIASINVLFFLAVGSYLLYFLTKKRLFYLGQTRQSNERFINKYSSESLQGIKDIKILNKENFFISQFNKKVNIKANVNIRSNLITQLPRVYLELISIVGVGLIIFVMILQNKEISVIISFLGLFIAASFRILPSLNRILSSIQNLKLSEPVVNTITTELIKISNNFELKNNEKPIIFNKNISFKNVFFTYNKEINYILNDISFNIKKGQTVGIIGESGAGKTTLIDILLGLLNPISGSVCVDGIDINNSKVRWRDKIGYVPQSIYLLDDTIKSNIAFGVLENEIDYLNLNRVISTAQLSNFIKTLDNGIETNVGDRGIKLSGGQRQRIGIARALYRNPEILFFDEATSALDNNTESEFMNSIDLLKGEKTIIIIAHRISTLKKCDAILEIKNGSLIFQPPN